MKKYLLLCLSLCLTLITIAAPWDIKPISKTLFTDPDINYASVSTDDQGHVTIALALYYPPERAMRANVWVRTYRRIGLFNWQWVWLEYVLTLQPEPYMNTMIQVYNLNPEWQYSGHANSIGGVTLYSDQFNISYYGPL